MVEINMLPRVIQEENDPEVLRAFMGYILNQNEELKKELSDLRAEKAKVDQQRLKLDDELLVYKKKLFGASSEKRNVSDRYRSKQQRQMSIQGASLVPPPSEEEQAKLTEVLIDHELTSKELGDIAEQYGYPRDSEWEHLRGFYDESSEIDVVVQSYRRKKHRRHKYRLKASKGADEEIIVTAPTPKKIVPGATYSPEFAVEVVASKYLYHLPLERIRRQMEAAALTITCKTLYSLCFFVSCYLEGVVQRILQEILSCGLALHIDETPWRINNIRQSDGYMWVMSNQAGSYYQFEPTRSGAIAKELIGSYRGPVVTDGYGGYKSQYSKVEGIRLAFCWAHARRKFTDIEKNYPKECGEILDLIGELFQIEREAEGFIHLNELRETRSKGIVDKIRAWLLDTKLKARGESGLEKAINYSMNHWQGLILFLEDLKIPLSNNEVERTIRHAVMGRKNFHGSRTINGADVASTLYTIIESCKKVELDPKSYLLMAVKEKIEGREPPTPLEYARQTRTNPVKTA